MNGARNTIACCLLGAALTMPVRVDSKSDDSDDSDKGAVVVADRLATAFLEEAPRSVQRRFKRALDDACEWARSDPPEDDKGRLIDFEYFCSGKPLRYLREVLVTGLRIEEGWICPKVSETRIKYFPADYTAYSECALVTWDPEEQAPQVHLESIGEQED